MDRVGLLGALERLDEDVDELQLVHLPFGGLDRGVVRADAVQGAADQQRDAADHEPQPQHQLVPQPAWTGHREDLRAAPGTHP